MKEVTQYLTIKEVAETLRISTSTIYNNGPAQYGGVKIGRLWRFPVDKIGMAPEPKQKQSTCKYVRRFGNKRVV